MLWKKHYPNRPQIPDHPYKILIITSSGSGTTNALLRYIKQPDDDNLCVKNPNEAKYQYLSKKGEKNIVGNLKNPKFLI